jgi:hypothetical protein
MNKEYNQTTAIAIQDHNSPQAKATTYVTSNTLIGPAAIEPITKLYEIGFQKTHIDMLLETIDIQSAKQTKRVNNLLTAIRDTYTDNELEQLSSDYDKFKAFTKSVGELEAMREEMESTADFKPAYHTLLSLTKFRSIDEIKNLCDMSYKINTLDLLDIMNKSEDTGIFPETYIDKLF